MLASLGTWIPVGPRTLALGLRGGGLVVVKMVLILELLLLKGLGVTGY